MEKVIKKLREGIEDLGGETSKDFRKFGMLFKREFAKEVAKVGGTNLEQSIGHYYLSGFFDVGEQSYYYSISDVRHFTVDSILLRTADSHKDFRGGSNHYVELRENMLVNSLPRA